MSIFVRIMLFSVLCCLYANAQSQEAALTEEKLLEQVEINLTEEITDEAFFGKYDLKAGRWIIEPKLDYSLSNKLRAVEYLSRKGDYESAGKELLKYYRNRDFKGDKLPKSWNEARVELWSDNIFGFDQQERLVKILDISDKPQVHEIDVSAAIREGASSYMFMGRNKNEKLSYISSKESKTSPPILELLIEGKRERIEASADNYIRAGKYGDENYGSNDTLEICNSGITSQHPFDDNTRRALISFNLAKIDLSSVQSAKLKINAWSEKPTEKLIVWFSHPTIINELKDNWNNTLGYQYSWEGIETGVEWSRPKGAHGQYPNWVRRMYWLPQMTAASIIGENPELTRTTIDLLLDFINDYPHTPQPGWNRELNAGLGRISYLCQCIPHLFQSETLKSRDCVDIVKFLWREGEYLHLNPSKLYRDNFDNMGISLISAMINLSATYPEIADSKLWLADAHQRLEILVDHLVTSDGAYIEHTMGYPFAVLDMMLDLIDFCEEHNVVLPHSFAVKTHQLAKYLMNVSFPDGVPPRWGEGNPRDTRTSAVIKRAADFFNDSDLKWWCNLSDDSHKPDYTSVHYPDAKIIVSRSGWGDDDFVMFFAPRAGGAHLHVDQNHISLYAYGSKLLVDTGMSSYSSSHPHFDWQRHQTKSHNTVEVDEQGYPRTGNRTNDGLGAPEPECKSDILVSENLEYMKGYAAGYPNVEHNRSIMYLKEPGLYIVADVLIPNDEKIHTYDQCWHLHPNIEFEVDKINNKVISSQLIGAAIDIELLYPADAEVIVRKGFNANPLGDTTYPSYRQKAANIAKFYTLLLPKPKMGSLSVNAKQLETSSLQAKAFELDLPTGKGIYIHNPQNNKAVEVYRFFIEAEFTYIQLNTQGEIDYAVMLNGKSLTANGENVKFVELSDKGI